jgi:hypothetical protein
MADYGLIVFLSLFIASVLIRDYVRSKRARTEQARRDAEAARVREEAAKPLLIKVAQLDPDLSFSAAQALAQLGDVRAVERLIEFASTPHRTRSEAAVRSLEEILRVDVRSVSDASLIKIWKLEVERITGMTPRTLHFREETFSDWYPDYGYVSCEVLRELAANELMRRRLLRPAFR